MGANTQYGRFYKDGKTTFYSGRLYEGSKIGTSTQYTNFSNKTLNRRLRERDTFMSVFPSYRVQRDAKHSTSRKQYYLPDGILKVEPFVCHKMWHLKMDRIKEYTEAMLKIKDMQP